MRKEKNSKLNIQNTIKATKYLIKYIGNENDGRLYLSVKCILAIIDAIYPVTFIVFPGLIINELTNQMRMHMIMIYVIAILTIPVVKYLVNAILTRIMSKLSMSLRLRFDKDYYCLTSNMDYKTLEMPDIQTKRQRARQDSQNNLFVIDLLFNGISAFFNLIAVSSIIITLNPCILILLLTIVYINSLVTKWLRERNFILDKEHTKYFRREYCSTYALDDLQFAKEVRLFDLCDFFIEKFVNSRTESNSVLLKKTDNENKAGFLYAVTNLVQQGVVYIYILYSVINNGLPIGNMTIQMSAINQVAGSMGNLMQNYLGLSGMSLSVIEMMEFYEMYSNKPSVKEKIPVFTNNTKIEFRNVSFKYPGNDNYSLKNLSIVIHAGEKLSIVGMNGAGKTTFIKLLTRLYEPTEGEILLDGVNINEFDNKKYLQLFSPVFQDYGLYYMSLEDNIVLNEKKDDNNLNRICEKSGLSTLLQKLTHGYETQVYKWEAADGFEPSGGEGQKIAIARAIYRDSQIFLLDEPTASLDPISEYEIYTQFHNMIDNKTAILITHRLSAVQLTDNVAVFDNGGIVEYGSHQELYAKGGIYTEMFDKQAHFYRNTDSEDETTV